MARGVRRLVVVTRAHAVRREPTFVADAEIIAAPRGTVRGAVIGIIVARRADTPSGVDAAVIAVNFYRRLAKRSPVWPSGTLPEGRHAVECACLLFEELAVT